MRIGILTGGGDVPGLNPCIKAVAGSAAELGWETIGFRRGWSGPLEIDPDDPESVDAHTIILDRGRVRGIDRTGGTILHTSRTNPGRVAVKDLPPFIEAPYAVDDNARIDCTDHVLEVIDRLGIQALIAIGGDDTLSYAARLHQEGVKVMACPKTMDNDVYGTDYCIGFGTAVSRSVDAIDALRTPTGSHERIAVIELFGRNSGETALISGYLAAADRVLISEVPFDVEKVAELIMQDKAANPAGYAMIVISEGATIRGGRTVESGEEDPYGHRKLGGIGNILGEEIKRLTGQGIVNQSLAYLMRAGAPDALDRMVASAYGTMAVQKLAAGESGLMMAIRDGNYETVPIDTCIQGKKRVDVAQLYDADAYRPVIRQVQGKPMFLY
ncbi:ATP-dependent 6-phosphofructokinase [Iodidimonas sp. SYSU 1G8]|uniref:6-phosphofructokinase n=1 Tax=Iodidimonas sp. SYSU 1G8 TaxID=3133967 RepID=UPI0031FED0A4